MTITALPDAPSRSDSATFATKADALLGALPGFVTEMNAESARLSALGFGSYSATSATSLAVGTGSKSLTCEAGKGFVVGQPVMIASTASPSNYMIGQVTSYDSGTGALEVSVATTGGSGTIAAWSVSVISIFTGESPDSLVVLTYGTSWTCPAGVTKVRLRMCGGGGGGCGGGGTSGTGGGGGGGGGYVEAIFAVTPYASYTYAIGSGGGGSTGGATGTTGGTSTFTAGATTYSATGGSGGRFSSGSGPAGGAGGSGSGAGAFVALGATGDTVGSSAALSFASGGISLLGTKGGDAGQTTGFAGDAGKILLELYK